MNILGKYAELMNNKSEFACVFNINRLGSIMFLDGNVKVILDENLGKFEAEEFIDQSIKVFVKSVDYETNSVYVSRVKSLEEKIAEIIESGKHFPCVGTVIRVNRNFAYLDIENSGIIGVIAANSWRKNAYIRSLTDKCSVGDNIECSVIERNSKQDEMNAIWKLSREEITTDPWDTLMDDVWVEDATINVECVEIPKGKSYWWAKCAEIEDIELTGDFSSRFEVRINGKYRCKIREVDKSKGIFRVAPFAEISIQADDVRVPMDNESKNDVDEEDNGEIKQADSITKLENADAIIAKIIDVIEVNVEVKKSICEVFSEHSLSNEQQIFCLKKATIILTNNGALEKAHEVLRSFRGNFSINPNTYLGLVAQVASQLKKRGDTELVDALYAELLLFLKMNISSAEPKVFVGTMNAAINFYIEEKRYADVIKFLSIYISKLSPNDEFYNFENARLYFYRGMHQESRGCYSAAKSEFYFCLKYANKKKNKDEFNKYIGMAVSEMKRCDSLIEEMKGRPKTDADIIDEYYQKLEYEEAYKFALKLYTDNKDNLDVVELYNRAKEIYEKSQIRMSSLPLESKKGKYFRAAFAAESIEGNLERAEKLWKKSIELKEPGRLYAISAYISVLCKDGKYYDALEAHERYQTCFIDIVEIYSFRIKVIDIYRKLGAFEEAVADAKKIANKYAKNKKFLDAGGEKRLASLYQTIAYILSKELGKYSEANVYLDKAKEYGIDKKIYATSYINNCVVLGQYDRVGSLIDEYEDYLSDEYIASIRKNLLAQNNSINSDSANFWDQHFIQNSETFFDWYLATQFEECTEDVKTYFEMEELKSAEAISDYISKYDNYETNLKAQMYLNIIAAKYIIDTLDGYASNDFYAFVARAIDNDIEIRNRTNRRNIALFKYVLIALYESHNEVLLKESLERIIKELTLEKDSNNLRKYIAILFNNNPILKNIEVLANDSTVNSIQNITGTATLLEAKKTIENILNEYTEKQNLVIEKKNILRNYLEADLGEADAVLVEFLGNTNVLVQDDRNFVNKLIDINRTLMGVSKQKDYLSIDALLAKASEMIKNTRSIMEDGITPLCLLIWFDILDSYERFIANEKDKIEVTLSSRISVSIENTSLFSSHGQITITYLIRNQENCAPAKDIHISFEDSEGNLLISKDVVIDKLLGGEAKSLSQDFNAEKTFSLIMNISFFDNFGVMKKIECSESIVVNQDREFVNIRNPFTISDFNPNDPNRIFVGRDELINNLRTQLKDETIRCAVLYGQKRTGKSSIFNKLANELANDFVAVKILMSNVSSMDMFYRAVAMSFKREESNSEKVSKIKSLGYPKDNFEFEDYLDSIRELYSGKRILLLLDEFSHLYDLRNTEFPECFMNSWKEMMEYNLFSAVITGQETLNDLFKIYPNQFAVQYTVPVEYISYKYFRDLVDKPIYDENGCSRFEENSIEIFWQLTKGQPYLSQILAGKLVEYLNSNKMEKIYDATINKVVDEYIRTATEKDFDSFYCKYSKNAGEYTEEVSLTLRLLIKIAEECSYNGNYSCDISRISMTREEEAIKADLVRRGVIVIENNRCEIFVRLFYEWLRSKGKNTFSMQETYRDVVSLHETRMTSQGEGPSIVNHNNYFTVSGNVNQVSGDVNQVQGDLIHSQVNNVTVSIDNAVMGLERLQKMIESPSDCITVNEVNKQIEEIRFDSTAWDALSENEQEEIFTEYAERIFSSDAFVNKELTENQKMRFQLNDKILGMLSSDCRKQITCGIQVYDLIQYCIDNFGLEMNGLESPRAILFARAFEKHMKDCMYKAFGSIEAFSNQTLKLGAKSVPIADYPIDRTTIGNYTTMLTFKSSYRVLVEYAKDKLSCPDRDESWWIGVIDNLKKIGNLRNECCHSGSAFDVNQLENLVNLIFKEKSIEAVYFVREIYESISSGKKTGSKLASEAPIDKTTGMVSTNNSYNIDALDEKLIGKKCTFIMNERTSRKSIRGLINGRFPASMSPNEAKKTEFKNGKKISVLVDSIQDGKYVVRIV